jgi:RNA polymerase sigma factor (sigma-70 family)
MNPLTSHPLTSDADDATDRALVERAIDGSRDALRQLVERHQPFVYNIALKMFGRREDAQDLTQEVFVKVITSLKTFRHESSLRTWLYRVTVNHFLKARRRALELVVDDFESYFDAVAVTPDEEPSAALGVTDETIEELRLRCTSGMLMCLDREQRLIFILGAIFNVSHQLGGDVFSISPGNFRVRLHRARRDLYSWMTKRCGLVNPGNPCRCSKKTTGYVRRGIVDPNRLVFNADYVLRIEALTRKDAASAMQAVDELHDRVFTTHPLQSTGCRSLVDEILGNQTLRTFFSLT